MDREFGRLEGRIDSYEKRLDGLERKVFEEVKSLHDKVDKRFEDLRGNLSEEMGSVRAEFSDVRDGINLLGVDVRDHMVREEASIKSGWFIMKVVASVLIAVTSGLGWLYTNVVSENDNLRAKIEKHYPEAKVDKK